MAKRQVVSYEYTDDLSGEPIPESEAESGTRRISWDGSTFVVQLGAKNAAELDEILSQLKTFVAAGQRETGRRGRRAGGATTTAPKSSRGRRSSTAGSSSGSSAKRGDLSAVRSWARENGWNVSERGRIPAALLNAYDAANNGSATAEETPAAAEASAPAAAPTARKARGRRARAAAKSAPKRTDLGAVRAWARETGRDVSERGRIPAALLAAYDAATNGSNGSANGEEAPATPARKRAPRKKAAAVSS